jgi:hypothetical protein
MIIITTINSNRVKPLFLELAVRLFLSETDTGILGFMGF